MITLATLNDATAQQVFDQVAKHLLTQGEQALNTNGLCVYRAGDKKCAVGCLIADEEYKPSMESNDWEALIEDGTVPIKRHKELICSLQIIHDYNHPSTWKENLESVAKTYGLELNPEIFK